MGGGLIPFAYVAGVNENLKEAKLGLDRPIIMVYYHGVPIGTHKQK